MFGSWKRIAGAVGFGCFVLLRTTNLAHALCQEEEERLLWSYPRNGESAVPRNADFYVSGKLCRSVELDGVEVPTVARGVYDLGSMAANTMHEVVCDDVRVVFSTGDATNAEEAALSFEGMAIARNPLRDADCPLVPQSCFDEPTTSVLFDPGPADLAWVVETLSCNGTRAGTVWPVECGPPLLERTDQVICANFRAANASSLSEATGTYCSAPVLPEGVSLPQSSDCRRDWPPEGTSIVVGIDEGARMSKAPDACSLSGTILSKQSMNSSVALFALLLLARRHSSPNLRNGRERQPTSTLHKTTH